MLPPLVAQVVDESAIVGFVGITIPFLILAFIVYFAASNEGRLIALGVLMSVAAVGYSCIVVPGGAMVTPSLMKIAFLLVLAGVVMRLLANCSACIPVGEPISEPTPAPQEPRHE